MELSAELIDTITSTRNASRKKDPTKPEEDKKTLDLRDSQIEGWGKFEVYAEKYKGFARWNLSQNYLTDVPESFSAESQIKELLLSENTLSSMLGFDGNIYLTLLDLSNNQIKKIEGLTNLPELRVLVIHRADDRNWQRTASRESRT